MDELSLVTLLAACNPTTKIGLSGPSVWSLGSRGVTRGFARPGSAGWASRIASA